MRFRRFLTCWVACTSLACVAPLASADQKSPTPVRFAEDVEPILRAHCYECHGPDEQEGQLRLDARAAVIKGGVSGDLLVAGKANDSLLFQRLVTDSEDERMPLEQEPLKADEIDVLRRWINEGATWPEGVGAVIENDEPHWAYVAPKRPALDNVILHSRYENVIDAVVYQKLTKEGLDFSPAAERARLLRRVSLDLTGVPPTVEEVDRFLADNRPDAYDRMVDRLLCSPRYALKWARNWLDSARYADSNGYQADQYRNVWPYRDWVIDAMNQDMPFDQFTIEQLAGDLLPNATTSQHIATGFHRLTTCNVEAGVDPEENRTNQVIDRVNTTGTVWLGTTLECAQCHSHKYDPFSQREYYQIFDYFNSTPLEVEGNGVTYNFTGPKMNLPLSAEQQAKRTALEVQMAQVEEQITTRSNELSSEIIAWEESVLRQQQAAPKWHVLAIDSFVSENGAAHEVLDDQSVLLSGPAPPTDVYTVKVRTNLSQITGFKLEALTHDSLPGKGPGRHAAERPNFVLHEFQVHAESMGNDEPVGLRGAKADFSQSNFAVANAIDGKSDTAWAIAPQFHKPHEATFLAVTPVGDGKETTLTFVLDQHHGQGRTIGRLRLSAMTGTPTDDALPANVVKIAKRPRDKRTAAQQKTIRDYFLGLDGKIKQLRAELEDLKKKQDAITPITTLVMIEDKDRMTNVFRRGNFLDKGEEVRAGTPRVLHSAQPEQPKNRLGFARWLVDSSNPLTPRVVANRWWAEMFGAGIVATTEDFGTQGEQPTHPEILDWLALEFRNRGWSMKKTHRLIVTSATYRQTSRVSDELLRRDPYNHLLSRAPRIRLSAETIRDNALAASGLLMEQMGGPPIYPPQPAGHWRHVGRNEPKYDTSQGTNRFRRGIYVIWRRSAPYPSFTTFDAPDRAACVVQRSRTNTPLQALTLMNDPVYLEMALALAERMATDRSDFTIDQKLRYGFRLCVSREPTAKEIALLEDVYRNEIRHFEKNEAVAASLVGDKASRGVPTTELAAWFYIANILFNLDETITKG